MVGRRQQLRVPHLFQQYALRGLQDLAGLRGPVGPEDILNKENGRIEE
jgi:hypothetical protein